MKKQLSEMSLEELWNLFPIFLVPHKERWKKQYEEMETMLRETFSQHDIRISHIGSTAIDNIYAKDIVDILMEVDNSTDLRDIAREAENIGFIRMSERKKRIFLNYGYTPDGFADKVYHLHLRYKGDNDEIYFRDYLNTHPDIAAEYEKLKLELWKKFEHDRNTYTEAKTSFIKKWTVKAKESIKLTDQTPTHSR